MMKKIGRVIITTVLASSLVVTPVFAEPSIDNLKDSKAAAQSEANSLQTELKELLGKMNQLESNLIIKGQEVEKATTELAVAKEKEEKQYNDMKLRIKYMYEAGNTGFAEKILTADSISEVLNQAEYAQTVHSYDRKMLTEYVKTKEQVATLKSSLETEMSNIESMQSEFETKEASLNTTLETKREEVANFDEEIQTAAAAVAAAAAKAQETSNANKTNNGGTGNSNNHNENDTDDSGSSNGGSQGNTSTAQGIVNAAYGYIGVPYVYGGVSSSGLDCSGLVMLAHRAVGIGLPHSSGAQGGGGRAVSRGEAQAGDVVCYAGHVGIYLGGGSMIHAPKPGDKVKVAAVYGSPWYRRYW